MDKALREILESLLLNSEVLGQELMRLERSELFRHTSQCFQLIERIRDTCTDNLRMLHTVERRLYTRDLRPPPDSEAGEADEPRGPCDNAAVYMM